MKRLHLPLAFLCSIVATAGLGCDKSKAEDEAKKTAKADDAEPKEGDAKGADASGADTDPAAEADDKAGAGAGAEAGAAAEADPDAPTGPVFKEEEGDRWLVLEEERVGELHLGMKPDEAVKILGEPKQKGEIVLAEATGDFVSSWTFPDKGVTLDMASVDDKGTDMTVDGISADKTCTLPLPWGLKIGSERADVEKVYGKDFDDNVTDDNTFVAGSVYGGTFYGFEDGKVVSIFIGAGAE